MRTHNYEFRNFASSMPVLANDRGYDNSQSYHLQLWIWGDFYRFWVSLSIFKTNPKRTYVCVEMYRILSKSRPHVVWESRNTKMGTKHEHRICFMGEIRICQLFFYIPTSVIVCKRSEKRPFCSLRVKMRN